MITKTIDTRILAAIWKRLLESNLEGTERQDVAIGNLETGKSAIVELADAGRAAGFAAGGLFVLNQLDLSDEATKAFVALLLSGEPK